jgi:hypothetical protein
MVMLLAFFFNPSVTGAGILGREYHHKGKGKNLTLYINKGKEKYICLHMYQVQIKESSEATTQLQKI